MAYYTGVVHSFADLKTTIETIAVEMGWSLDNGILNKNGAYVQLTADSSGGYTQLRINGGTGQLGSSLINPPVEHAKISDGVNTVISWPITYYIHAFNDVDEVYCVINYNVESYELMAFGISSISGVGGTKGWFHGTRRASAGNGVINYDRRIDISAMNDGGYIGANNGYCNGLFSANSSGSSSFIHHALDGEGWRQVGSGGFSAISALLFSLPSPFNEAHVLLPLKGLYDRPTKGSKTIVVQPAHVRHLRIDNLEPGDVIQYGLDKWKIYPWLAKGFSLRNGGTLLPHSGTFGFAIRYDGP